MAFKYKRNNSNLKSILNILLKKTTTTIYPIFIGISIQFKKILSIFNNHIPNQIRIWLLTPISSVSFISIILLIFISPVYSIILLVVSSFFFIYIKNYKSIYKIWVVTLGIWYLIFSTTLSEIPIIIGFNETHTVIFYLIDNNVLFLNLSLQTVVILHVLSNKLGFIIYVPSIINIIKAIILFIKSK